MAARGPKADNGSALTWHEKVEEGPEFEDAVLDRCSGQDEPVVGGKALDSQGRLGLGVADGVAFVQDEVVEVEVGEKGSVVSDDLVGRNHDEVVRLLRQVLQRRPQLLPGLHRAVVNERAKHVGRNEL